MKFKFDALAGQGLAEAWHGLNRCLADTLTTKLETAYLTHWKTLFSL